MTRLTFHLIANAHLDPVWLWDWRDGMTEGLITCRTMLDLMDEFPDFTFIRGEAAIYRHIEQHDPATFARIARRVAEGRWDVVGGTWIQPDTNLPATETFVRHYHLGQRYLASRFGRPVQVAWAADSFGHAAGLPDIMAGAGIDSFAFTRPDEATLPLPLPAFWWEGSGGNRILSYRPLAGWYGSDRHEVAPKLDKLLTIAQGQPLANVGFFYGLGDHGGGASRRHLAEIRAWAAQHPEVDVVHSGLHRLFAALRSELATNVLELPVHRGEMNFTCRGCYASVAKFKWPYRRAEAQLSHAEAMDTLIGTGLGRPLSDLAPAWESVLFNSFHDILPGSSIERSYDDQLAALGAVTHRSLEVEHAAFLALAGRIDTRMPAVAPDHPTAVPFLVWNPHPYAFNGQVELEANLDYRLIPAYRHRDAQLPVEVRGADGAVLPHQIVENEHQFAPDLPWRKRAVIPLTLPPLGWQLVSLAWVEGAVPPAGAGSPAVAVDDTTIANGRWRVSTGFGAEGVRIACDGHDLFTGSGLGVAVFPDAAGSWGGKDGPQDLALIRQLERWTVERVAVRERGPERVALWVRLAGQSSHVDLAFLLQRGTGAVEVRARWHIDEHLTRVRLLLPGADYAVCEVPGGSVARREVGDMPALGWLRVSGPLGGYGFASDALSSFALTQGGLSATVIRATHFAYSANDPAYPPDPWWPVMDVGEHRCRFAFYPPTEDLAARSRELASPPLAQVVPATAATGAALPASGSLASLAPAGLLMLACKPAADGDGLVLRVHETTGETLDASLTLFGQQLALGRVAPGAITSWRLRPGPAGWSATTCNLLEQ
jgi:alpha-mannosidase